MKVRVPSWLSNLRGPWPPDAPPIPEEHIRKLAERLSQQRPLRSSEENWYAAEQVLQRQPWRSWIIRFSGEKERSGWDWADLSLKLSVPILILGLSTAYSIISADRQENIARSQKTREEKIASDKREGEVLTEFIKEMKPLLLEGNLTTSAPDAEVRAVARGLTLATLSQLKAPEGKTLAVRFLLDSGLNEKSGNLINLSGANLSGADLRRVNLSRGRLYEARVRGANLSLTDLSEVDLRAADLRETNLKNANLKDANMSGANLKGANLNNADLSGANLKGATLEGAYLTSTNLSRAKIGGANLIGAKLSGADLPHANLLQAFLRKAVIPKATLYKADLTLADLRGAILVGSILNESILRGAKLQGANLAQAGLGGADLSLANLSGAKLEGANLARANLIGADLSMADLSRANLEYVIWDKDTKWPLKMALKGAKNLSSDLKRKLGLN